jgi:hypothetical protein
MNSRDRRRRAKRKREQREHPPKIRVDVQAPPKGTPLPKVTVISFECEYQ